MAEELVEAVCAELEEKGIPLDEVTVEYDERYHSVFVFSRNKEIVEKLGDELGRNVDYNPIDGYFIVYKDYKEVEDWLKKKKEKIVV